MQITSTLYLDAFTFAMREELPGNFYPLLVVVVLQPSLSTRQGQQQGVYRPVSCHHQGKQIGNYKRPWDKLQHLFVQHPHMK